MFNILSPAGAHFIGNDLDAAPDDGLVAGIAHAEALVPVAPFAGQAGEEVVAGHNQDATPLEPLV